MWEGFAISKGVKMNEEIIFKSAIPKLVMADMTKTCQFYQQLDFKVIWQTEDYLILERDNIILHFWQSNDKYIAENTAYRINVSHIEALYQLCQTLKIVHPNDPLQTQPWGSKEFSILDVAGNLITFSEPA